MPPKAVWKNVDLTMEVKAEPGVPVGRPGNGQSAEDTESITPVRLGFNRSMQQVG